jgi:hypothetical protein
MSSPADLLRALVSGVRDGSLTPAEAGEVLEHCAQLMEALADHHVKSWWGRLVLSAAAGAIRQAAEELEKLPAKDD